MKRLWRISLVLVTGFLLPKPCLALQSSDLTVQIVESSRGGDAGGGTEIVINAYPESAVSLSPGSEWYLEFTLGDAPPDSVVTIEAYDANALPAPADSLNAVAPVSVWEITPMDHEAGQGRYVRLYLPSGLLAATRTGNGLALDIRAQGLASSVVAEALRAASVVVAGRR